MVSSLFPFSTFWRFQSLKVLVLREFLDYLNRCIVLSNGTAKSIIQPLWFVWSLIIISGLFIPYFSICADWRIPQNWRLFIFYNSFWFVFRLHWGCNMADDHVSRSSYVIALFFLSILYNAGRLSFEDRFCFATAADLEFGTYYQTGQVPTDISFSFPPGTTITMISLKFTSWKVI